VRDPQQTARARELRKTQTPAEEALWALLRDRNFLRLKFRRQVPIGRYIADFYCRRYKLVIELDGSIHEDRLQAAHDKNRDFYLRTLGLTILRFTNQQVFEDPDAVLQKIHETVG
jgi:very-short-patch-repair endonuclease